MNLYFVHLINDFAFSKGVPENMTECLESLEYKWKINHIHKNITSEIADNKHNIYDATSKFMNAFLMVFK